MRPVQPSPSRRRVARPLTGGKLSVPRSLGLLAILLALLVSLLATSAASAQEELATPVDESAERNARDLGDSTLPPVPVESLVDVNIVLRSCPAGYDLAAAGSHPPTDCTTPVGGVTFGAALGSLSSSATSDTTGVAPFENLYPSTWTFTQTMSPDVASSFIWTCYKVGVPSEAPSDPLATGSSVTLALDAGASYGCLWFNVPAGDGGGTTPSETFSVIARKFACPADFDPASIFRAYGFACTTVLGDVRFDLSDRNGTTGDTTPSDGSGARFHGVSARDDGTVALTETVPTGYGDPVVFCHDSREANWVRQTTSGSTVVLDAAMVGEGILSCYVYNFPTEPTENGTGTVRLAKYTCPAGFDPTGLDDYVLSEQCREEVAPVSFSVSDGEGVPVDVTASAGVPQQAEVSGQQFGPISITETVPPGYGEPLVFCGDTAADGPGVYEPVSVFSGDTIAVTLRADADIPLTCIFFNMPDPGVDAETTTVDIVKHACPDGVTAAATDTQLFADCTGHPVATFHLNDNDGYSETATAPGTELDNVAHFEDVPVGSVDITEWDPEDATIAVVCADEFPDGENPIPWQRMTLWGIDYITWDIQPNTHVVCHWFNSGPDDTPDNTVTVHKYLCPSWVNPETDILLDVCTPGGDGIPFAFVDGNGRHEAVVANDRVEWTGVEIGQEGELQIIETIPAGYGDPIVVCDGIRMASTNGFVLPVPGEDRPFHIECDWFNMALEDATLRVVKHTCEPGYDLHAAGADPMADCPTLTDGIAFHLTGLNADLTSETGDAGEGAVQFGGLDPGAYHLEEIRPEGTASVFVLDCYGNAIGAVRPYPLVEGSILSLDVHAGETIECHVFNVPEMEDAEITVVKYICTTDEYVSDVDCQIDESGVTFDLHELTGEGWQYVATATTDDHGRALFDGLEPAGYWLDEQDGKWCHIESAALADDPPAIIVLNGDQVEVRVYNCGAAPGTLPETPTKYPDTGVPPAGTMAGTAPFAMLAGIALSRRRLAGLVASGIAGMATRAGAQDDGQVIEPIDGTPTGAPESSLCLPATPGAAEEEGCARGAVPATLRIDAIGVDAEVEILETVAGAMQQPSDADLVAWYKESARLGEPGNIWIAGHLNWWNVPEGVFFDLHELRAGDEVLIAGDDGTEHAYAVEWVRQEPAIEPPGDDVLSMTDHEAVTLITCGGEWDAGAARYTDRTVVRAVRTG